VTGYDERNLDISKEREVLGWVNRSNFLSAGSLVFVFNKDSLVLETCFEIKSQFSDKDLIWEDEKTLGKIIYGNRWNADVLYDNLVISLQEINSIPPFDKEKFQGLLRGNFPMPLDTPSNYDKYTQFREMLLHKLKSIPNYWIFIVANQKNLPAESIYRTRMNDKFWGFNERTPYRKALRKGDKVIFSQGAKMFLGTATLGSSAFELDDAQKNLLLHDDDIFRADYGVFLNDIANWEIPKDVAPYVDSLSFVSNSEQYPVYFQGGVKKISAQDYALIIGGSYSSGPTQEELIEETFEDSPLLEPDKARITEALKQIDEKLLIDKNSVMQIVVNLLSGRHIIIA
jgi:hypothetical protein